MLEYNLSLEASAGSGKTFALSIRYVSLLFLGAKPSSILTLTFTNKAATEMSDRIVGLLSELPNKEIELAEISKLTNLSYEEILKKQPSIYKEFLNSSINIYTIDKFNTQILRSFSLYLSLMPDFQLSEGVDEHQFLTLFLHEIKKENLYGDLVEFCVYEQKRVQEIFSFLSILNQKRNDLENIKITSYDIGKIKKDIFRIHQNLKELFLSCDALSTTAKNQFFNDTPEDIAKRTWIQKDSLSDYRYFKKCFTQRADELFRELKIELKNYFRAKEAYYKTKYLKIFEVYKRVKTKLNLQTNTLEFNDITNFVYELLASKKVDNSFLYFRLDSKIDHILIDEFQDTSITQYKILEPLIEEVVSGYGVKQNRSFFYVGDTKQSIYRFRGGVKELFSYVQKRFNVKKEYLNTNYRSTKAVVEFVNDTFKNKIKGYFEQIPNDKEDRGYIEVCEGEELLDLIASKVEFLLESGVKADDIAILTFSNDDAFKIQEKLLSSSPELETTTTTTELLINSRTVSAIIEFLKYLYFDKRYFLVNFLSLIGRDIDEEIDKNNFNIQKPLNFLIKDIVNYFGLFNGDEDIIKLIEISTTYKDIDEFIFESENIDTTSPKQKDRGIKLLTIHKSKGLEFDHIIVADRLKKKNSNKDSMIFYYDRIELKDMYIKAPNREFFDSDFKEAKEANRLLETEDELNTLYVALTRAKNSLIICQKEKDSSLSILSLSPFTKGEVIPSQNKEKKESYEKFEYEIVHTGLQDKTPTKPEEKDIKAINYGLSLHYMLENLNNFTIDEIESAFWAMKNKYSLLLEEDEFENIKQRVINLLNNKEFQNLIDGEKYKELPLVYDGEVKQLDLVVENKNQITIIDYKSSQEIHTKHKNQVKNYVLALKEITNKTVRGYLCYIRDDGVEMVEV